ncbi:MAG: transglutaminase TgpA family protein [Actinomycetota bacterium]
MSTPPRKDRSGAGGVRRWLVGVLMLSAGRRKPENSIGFRVAVLGAVMTAVVALALAGVLKGTVTLAAFVVLPSAFWVSWQSRGKDARIFPLLLTGITAIAFIDLVRDIRSVANPEAARYPLARLFLLVQLIHSYDLRARRDLYFSLGSSLVLMAVAGSISHDLSFGALLVVYAAFAVTALVLAHRSELADGAERATPSRSRSTARILREVGRAAVPAALAASLLFLVLPQPNGMRAWALPFTAGEGPGTASLDGIRNPGFPGDPSSRSSGSSYYALSERMDLRVRGSLSDDVVMRVRSSAPSMWRGMLFDGYDGTAWTSTAGEPSPLPGTDQYLNPAAVETGEPRRTISQTFYIQAEQPNTYFSAATPAQIWSWSRPRVDELGVLRASATLTPGTSYGVVSVKGVADARALRRVSNETVPAELQRYLQLPAGLPERVRKLAQRITAGAGNDYERVRAIEAYLRKNLRYSLDSPVPPSGHDAVDHFLFDARVGFCEQFASATAVMLRTLGVPARVAVGYTPGTKNPLTGLYEVKGSDAHAWVEVYFPGLGWYEFDPTFNVPSAQEDVGDQIVLVKLWRWAGAHVDGLAPAAPVAAVAIAVPLGAAWVWSRRRRAPARGGVVNPGIAPGPVARAWERLEADLARRGTPRRDHETASEVMARLVGGRSQPARRSVAVFERERYGRSDVTSAEAGAATEAIEELRRSLTRR